MRILVLIALLCGFLPVGQLCGQATDTAAYSAAYRQALAARQAKDPAEAIAQVQTALNIARQAADTVRSMEAMYLLLKVNIEARHYEEADALRRTYLALAQRYGKDAYHLGSAHNALGSMFSRMSERDSAALHFRSGLAALDSAAPAILRQSLMGNLASILGEQGLHKEAIALHREALALVDSTDLRNRAWGLNTLGQSLLYAGRYREAIAALDEADSLNQRGGHELDLAIDLAELRADCFDSIGDIARAYAMVKLVRNLQDTLFERSLDEQYLELEKRYGTQLKQEEIERLEAVDKVRAERLRLRNVQAIGSALLALLGIVLVLVLLRQRKRRNAYTHELERLNTELKDQQERIAEINRLLELKVLRARLDPHFIYNSITAIGVLARSGETLSAVAYLDGFARLMRMVLDHGLRDTVTIHEEMDFLRQYLKLEAMRFEGGLQYTVDADRSLTDEDVRVPSLLVQPFVENAIWHGLAPKKHDRRVHIHFADTGDAVECTVEDNGVGRKAASPRIHPDGSASQGVRLSDERLQLLAHRLGENTIRYEDLVDESGAASGTRVLLRMGA